MAEARHAMRKSARTTRLEAVTEPHRRLAPKAMWGRLSWTSSYCCCRSKATRDAPSVGLFIAIAKSNAAKPRRHCHQSP
jgi:hypothetical protein